MLNVFRVESLTDSKWLPEVVATLLARLKLMEIWRPLTHCRLTLDALKKLTDGKECQSVTSLWEQGIKARNWSNTYLMRNLLTLHLKKVKYQSNTMKL